LTLDPSYRVTEKEIKHLSPEFLTEKGHRKAKKTKDETFMEAAAIAVLNEGRAPGRRKTFA